jgi:hypothetical protein
MESCERHHETRPNAFQIALLVFTLVVLGALTADTIGRIPLAEAQCVTRREWPVGS